MQQKNQSHALFCVEKKVGARQDLSNAQHSLAPLAPSPSQPSINMKFAVAIALVACFAAANAEPRRLQVAGLVDLDEPTKSEAHRMTKWFAWKTVSCAAEDMGNQLATQASWPRRGPFLFYFYHCVLQTFYSTFLHACFFSRRLVLRTQMSNPPSPLLSPLSSLFRPEQLPSPPPRLPCRRRCRRLSSAGLPPPLAPPSFPLPRLCRPCPAQQPPAPSRTALSNPISRPKRTPSLFADPDRPPLSPPTHPQRYAPIDACHSSLPQYHDAGPYRVQNSRPGSVHPSVRPPPFPSPFRLRFSS